MTPVTTKRRSPQRGDARRRPGSGRSVAQPPTLFDAAPAGVAGRVDVGDRAAGVASRVDVGDRAAGVASRFDVGDRAADAPITAGRGETLDRLVVSSWERLVSHADAACLLCGWTMEPRYGAHAASIGGRCRDCGTTLS